MMKRATANRCFISGAHILRSPAYAIELEKTCLMKIQAVSPGLSSLKSLPSPPAKRLVLALAAGLLMGLTPAPVNAWGLAWVALVPLWVLVLTAPSPRRALGYGLLWGIGYQGLALSWLKDLHPLMWLGVPWLGSIATTLFAWMFVTLWAALIPGLWAWSVRWLCNRPFPLPLRILIGTALWGAIETLWSYGPLYWSPLSYTQSPHNLVILHLGQLSGPMLVTAAIVSFNGLLAAAWMQLSRHKDGLNARKLVVAAIGLLTGLHLLGSYLYFRPLSDLPQTALQIGIVQGNVPTRTKHFDEGVRRSLQHYTEGYETLIEQGADAVLTPEGAFPWVWLETPQQAQHPFFRAVVQQNIPAWVGTVGRSPEGPTQSLFTLLGTGEIVSRYDKVKLAPLGEYIPLRSVLGNLISRLSPVQSSLIPGDPNQRFDTPFGAAIVGICFDSAFPWLFRNQTAAGGTFILTASNNDPYDRGMMAQHHAQDTMRAIETDRWVARATNTGFSGIIDPHGRAEWISGFRTYEIHQHTLYRRQTQTLYVRWGDWVTPSLIGIALVGGSLCYVRQRPGQ
jgi:apolipoprotein N-acyltransferase